MVIKHEKPVGKVKPEREPDMEIKQNRHDTVLDWAAFLFDLGRFGMSAVRTSSQGASLAKTTIMKIW